MSECIAMLSFGETKPNDEEQKPRKAILKAAERTLREQGDKLFCFFFWILEN